MWGCAPWCPKWASRHRALRLRLTRLASRVRHGFHKPGPSRARGTFRMATPRASFRVHSFGQDIEAQAGAVVGQGIISGAFASPDAFKDA